MYLLVNQWTNEAAQKLPSLFRVVDFYRAPNPIMSCRIKSIVHCSTQSNNDN